MTEADFVEATRFASYVDAGKAAALLIEDGVASQVLEVVDDPDEVDEEESSGESAVVSHPPSVMYSLQVLPIDLERALATLGIEDRIVPEGTDDAPPKLEKIPTPWGRILIIWLIAIITIPLAAFAFTYYLLSL